MEKENTLIMTQKKKKFAPPVFKSVISGIPFILCALLIISDQITYTWAYFLISVLLISSVTLFLMNVREDIQQRKIGRSTFILGVIIWYAYPGFIGLVGQNYQYEPDIILFFDDETILWTIFYVSSFLFSGIIASNLLGDRPNVIFLQDYNVSLTNRKVIISLAVLGCLSGVMSFYYLGGNFNEIIEEILESRAIEKAWIQSSILGDAISPYSFLASSAMASGSMLLWLSVLDKNIHIIGRIILALLALISTGVIYLDQGTRSIFLLMVLPALIIKIIEVGRKWKLRSAVGIFLIFGIIFGLLQFILYYRTGLSRGDLQHYFWRNIWTLDGTIDYFKETVISAKIVPAYHAYFRESIVYHFLVSPIPRFLWPEKPVSELIWFFTNIRWKIDIFSRAGNALPGIIGQFYMSWGWIGPVVAGLAFGWGTGFIDRILRLTNRNEDIYSLALGIMVNVWVFISFRLLSPSFIYPVLLSFMVIVIAKKFGRVKSLGAFKN